VAAESNGVAMENDHLPAYCRACEEGSWSIHVWKKGTPGAGGVIRFKCRSWRHAGECAQWKGAQDFCRVKEAMFQHDNWVALTLTYPQAVWRNKTELYRAGLRHWSKLRKRFTRKWGKFLYVQTWERHKKGGAHVHVAISSKAFADACRGDGWREVRKEWLIPNAVDCGFGKILYVTLAYNRRGLAGYMGKLSRELTGAFDKGQVPWDAPSHFRRLRASVRLLPPPFKNPEWTGRMIFACPELAESITGQKEFK